MTSPRPKSVTAGVVCRSVSKRFGLDEAVRALDLVITPGETVALLGPNGAGKSTTLDMLLGLCRPDSGSIAIFGTEPDAAIAAGRVAAMLQTGALVQHLTVRELVSLVAGLYPRPRPIDETLALAGLASLATRRTQTLSGGEAQRVRFASAIVTDADLLILDEPTVALDVASRHAFWSAVRDIAAMGKTVIFATHYLDEADANADRIVLLAQGRIVADGSSTEIKAKVGGRTIHATLRDVEVRVLERFRGVHAVERHGDSVTLTCGDSDHVLRTLLDAYPTMCDIEVTGAGIEAAFLELTSKVAR